MPTLSEIVQGLLPPSRGIERRHWRSVCAWPPDLFAVAATIAERSSLYTDIHLIEEVARNPASERTGVSAEAVGLSWREGSSTPKEVYALWSDLMRRHGSAPVELGGPDALAWKRIVLRLLIIADVAAGGFGYMPSPRSGPLQWIVMEAYRLNAERLDAHSRAKPDELSLLDDEPVPVGGDVLPYLPYSLCIMVPPTAACVQPKAITPQLGCTLRSMTHNLALLPSIGTVRTTWYPAPKESRRPFNLLVVPFPYDVPGHSFAPDRRTIDCNNRLFSVHPDRWLEAPGGSVAREFAEFLQGLVTSAKREVDAVHGIVLPELALSAAHVRPIYDALVAKCPEIEIFVTGTAEARGTRARNAAAIYRKISPDVFLYSHQGKHHRWCLDAPQIRRYNLGHVLDPEQCVWGADRSAPGHSMPRRWWENTEIGVRDCHVMLFRGSTAICVLICEDLARYDPVLPIMNAIGPNLVIALLMDGPQLERRWCGRYATALAEDPGSSVLTVTSLGMIRRSTKPGGEQASEVALWKDAGSEAQALRLPKGDHALLLTLTSTDVEQLTMDGRSDRGATPRFVLSAMHGVRHPANPPAWIVPRST